MNSFSYMVWKDNDSTNKEWHPQFALSNRTSTVNTKRVYAIQIEKQGWTFRRIEWVCRHPFLVLLWAYKAEEFHGLLLYVDISWLREEDAGLAFSFLTKFWTKSSPARYDDQTWEESHKKSEFVHITVMLGAAFVRMQNIVSCIRRSCRIFSLLHISGCVRISTPMTLKFNHSLFQLLYQFLEDPSMIDDLVVMPSF